MSRSRSWRAAVSSVWYWESTSANPSPTSYPCSRSSASPRSPRWATTSRTLLSRVKASGTGRRRFELLEHDPVAVPRLRRARGRVALVAELDGPDAVHQGRRHAELRAGVFRLQALEQGDPVEDQRTRQVDRVDAAALAGAVDAGRERAEKVGHSAPLR